eukprot:TRINITY_DN12005_c0_g4_i3.p1 TRINITY_DN12005_c0_g4~~TRINITY_DN12005_c0_g4_i3.p1  ORF type:complete len:122 (+),score=18.32 TRINITY_DN12005_c0_g4_i3:337-702(+)
MDNKRALMAAELLQMTASPQLRPTLDRLAVYGATSTSGFKSDLSKAWLGTQAFRSVAQSGLLKSSRKPKMADVLRVQAIQTVAEYCKSHPNASQAEVKRVLSKAIEEFVVALSKAKSDAKA